MRITVFILFVIVFLSPGFFEWVKADSLFIQDSGKLKVQLYIFNDKTQLWDRAREETVKNISCDKLRGLGLPSSGEYYIDIEKEKNDTTKKANK